jgi:membrane fusion protein (multidrug efflux system)
MVEMPRNDQFRDASASTPNVEKPKADVWKRAGLLVAGLAAIAGAADYGFYYYRFGRFLVSTDDAYVEADSTIVAPKVGGYLAQVLVADNQSVTPGQALARIDDSDFLVALSQANAALAAAVAQVGGLQAQIVMQQAEIAQARAEVAASGAALTFARQDAARYRELARTGAGAVQRAQQTEAARAEALARRDHDDAALAAAERKLEVLAASLDQAKADVLHAKAGVAQAKLNLGYTTLRAAVGGTVGARSLRVGQYVTAGTQLMAIVPLDATYVIANFKETQIGDLKRGQRVEVTVDALPDLRLSARIDSFAPASGQEFALLPPDNATGNFTKVVQRIPVKIVFPSSAASGRLRPGMSVEPTVDTRPQTPPPALLSLLR